MYKIKRGTPARPTRLAQAQYPFASMKVDTYFKIPAGEYGASKSPGSFAPRVAGAAYLYASRHGIKFAIRSQKNGDVKIFRTE
jgi:hypothetical protein|tara:strand:- start:496 stop:744 length:249 start_codon:yes stop_codon:yes gene_type:complete